MILKPVFMFMVFHIILNEKYLHISIKRSKFHFYYITMYNLLGCNMSCEMQPIFVARLVALTEIFNKVKCKLPLCYNDTLSLLANLLFLSSHSHFLSCFLRKSYLLLAFININLLFL